jgi:hypothetical protein
MSKKSTTPSLEEIWKLEDEFTAFAGSATGAKLPSNVKEKNGAKPIATQGRALARGRRGDKTVGRITSFKIGLKKKVQA